MSGRYGTIKDANGREYEFEPIQNTSYGEPDGLFGINCGHSFRYIEEGSFFNRERTLDTKAEKERKAEERRQRNDELREERAARARKNDSVLGRVQNTAISTVTREVTKTLTRGIMGIFKKN